MKYCKTSETKFGNKKVYSYICDTKENDTMRFEVYDENYEVMASFNEHLDALDYFNNNPCKFVYDTTLRKVVEGSDK